MSESFCGKNDELIPVGSSVAFRVENQDQWFGPTKGTLIQQNGEFMIELFNGQTITIGKGYDAYPKTLVAL